MRVAVWTPLAPEASGIADYNALLLAQMAKDPTVRISAVVRSLNGELVAPEGVAVVAVEDYRAGDFDIDIYHVGNNPAFHGYVMPHVLRRPGILVLHDPALADCFEVLLGGRSTRIFEDEVAHNLGLAGDDPRVRDAIESWDRTELLLSRRLVEASRVTLVHSRWAAEHLRQRFGEVEVRVVPFAVRVEDEGRVPDGDLVVGVFGNIGFHKRVPEVVEAFAEARRRGLRARLIVAGRRDHRGAEDAIARLIRGHDLDDVVEVALDVEGGRFRELQASCDLLVGLRWPTAGETSASLFECFALGKAAIVSDVPQNRDFPEDFCRRVSVDAELEKEQLVAALLAAGRDPAATREAGSRARDYVASHCAAADVARAYLDEARRLAALPRSAPDTASQGLGVNVIASWAGATGLAEAGRRAALALLSEGVSMAIEDVNLWAKVDPGRIPSHIAVLPHGHPYPINLSFLNVNEFHVVSEEQLRGRPEDYLVAMWYWELPALPAEMVPEIDRVDEIWVASEFVRDVFLRYTAKPVTVMPAVVQPEADAALGRGDLGLPEDAVVFLVTFDANSTFARKNPYGAIKAFERAFGLRRRDVVLVVKVVNLDKYPVVQRDLRLHMERLGGVLIESDMSAGEIAALIRHCDVYVSMHRSEGFGLGLAEAMYFGRPVIATANSGNMDFMDAHNSCLVAYSSMVVHRDQMADNPTAMVLYQPGNLWVDPDVDHAAQLMRWLFEHPEQRERIGARAAGDIAANYSSAAAGRAMRARLDEIAALLAAGWRREELDD